MDLKRIFGKIRPEASHQAPWLAKLRDGTFPIDNEPLFRYVPGQVPLPNEQLRQTVSRPDLGGFYFIGESWALEITRMLASLPDRSRYRVLDVGCGIGKTARFLVFDPRIHYVGFDIFQPAIDWANTAFQHANLDRFRFEHFDGISEFYNPGGTIKPTEYKFPVEDGSVDVAFAASLFTHLYEDAMRAYLSQTARKLAPDGLALYSIKEAPADTQSGLSGTEQSIKMSVDYFVSAARDCGLDLHDPGRNICGQRAVVLRRAG